MLMLNGIVIFQGMSMNEGRRDDEELRMRIEEVGDELKMKMN